MQEKKKRTRSFDRSHSSKDAEVAFNKNAASNSVLLLTGWAVLMFLEDEGQQYGNMEEAAVARTPATCLEVWSIVTTGKLQLD